MSSTQLPLRLPSYQHNANRQPGKPTGTSSVFSIRSSSSSPGSNPRDPIAISLIITVPSLSVWPFHFRVLLSCFVESPPIWICLQFSPDETEVVYFWQELHRKCGEGNGNPLQYSCLGNPTDRGAWQATVHGVAKSQTRLSNFHLHLLTYTVNN